MYNKTSGKLKFTAPKRKVAKTPHRFDHHRAKICLNPNCLAYSKSPWTGANMHTRIYGQNMPWDSIRKKFLRFSNPTNGAKKTENNRFRVPIHLCNWPLYFWIVSASASIITPNKYCRLFNKLDQQRSKTASWVLGDARVASGGTLAFRFVEIGRLRHLDSKTWERIKSDNQNNVMRKKISKMPSPD